MRSSSTRASKPAGDQAIQRMIEGRNFDPQVGSQRDFQHHSGTPGTAPALVLAPNPRPLLTPAPRGVQGSATVMGTGHLLLHYCSRYIIFDTLSEGPSINITINRCMPVLPDVKGAARQCRNRSSVIPCRPSTASVRHYLEMVTTGAAATQQTGAQTAAIKLQFCNDMDFAHFRVRSV